MATIHSGDFWQPYLPELRRLFSELTMDILIAGGDAGAVAVPAASALVDWDVFNESALSWLDMYLGGGAVPGLTQEGAYAWVWALNESTRRGVVREIDRWVRSGAPLPELEKRLGSFFDERRARRIAVTEVTRIYASGNVMAWKASGVVNGKRWRTAVDERACPICARLNNTLVELDRGWEFSQGMLEADPALARALRAPMTVVVPPAHVACRCWLAPVVFEALSDEERAAGAFEQPTPVTIGQVPMTHTPRPLAPTGRPVSAGLHVPKASKNRVMYDRVLSAIDRVHGDGNLPGLTVFTRRLKPGRYGAYLASGKPYIEITSDPRIPKGDLSLTLVHEIGHYLDHKGIDSLTTMATRDEMVTHVWREAVSNSRAVKTLIDQYNYGYRYGVDVDGYVLYPSRGYLDYLLMPEEIWARSYSQYISVRSRDPDLLKALAAERDDPMYRARQWDDDDFEPIAKAFDTLFEVLGWLKR